MLTLSKFGVIRCLIPFLWLSQTNDRYSIRVKKTNTDLALRLNNQTWCLRLFKKIKIKVKWREICACFIELYRCRKKEGP